MNLRSCMSIIGIGSLLFGLLLVAAFVFGYDPTGVSSRLGLNLFVLLILLAGFWGLGGALLYVASRSRRNG